MWQQGYSISFLLLVEDTFSSLVIHSWWTSASELSGDAKQNRRSSPTTTGMLFFNQVIFLHGFTKELAPSVEAICSSQCFSLTSQVRSSWATQWIQVSHPRRLCTSSPSALQNCTECHTKTYEQHNIFLTALIIKKKINKQYIQTLISKIS